MAGTLGSAADMRVALVAVASIDRLKSLKMRDHHLQEILNSAANVLQKSSENAAQTSMRQDVNQPRRLH
ncbi:MAG: hypothetical protein JXQ85_16120 [Cognatishimia sp.]|uniref:hypothetical protein n=1 Tax=Cognatishimia sp. TaxID=2211648 RepID=UPI003B8C6BA8